MKVTVRTFTKEVLEDNDYSNALEIKIDGKSEFKAHDGEIEDNNLCRNFSDCFNIPELMMKAYEAGKNGEKFEVVTEEVEEI